MFGILPSYGLYARHVDVLTANGIDIRFKAEDERPAVVLDDVQRTTFSRFNATVRLGVPVFVKVANTRKREPDREYVKKAPYKATTVNDLVTPPGLIVQSATLDRPAPGTPPDSLSLFYIDTRRLPAVQIHMATTYPIPLIRFHTR
jgi:hypothetical protein